MMGKIVIDMVEILATTFAGLAAMYATEYFLPRHPTLQLFAIPVGLLPVWWVFLISRKPTIDNRAPRSKKTRFGTTKL